MKTEDSLNSDSLKRIAKIVQTTRQRKGHTVEEAAHLLKLTRVALHHFEKGQPGFVKPTVSLLKRISDYTGIPVGVLATMAAGEIFDEDLAVFEVASLIPDKRYRSILNFLYAVMTTLPLKSLREFEIMGVQSVMDSKKRFADLPEAVRCYLMKRGIERFEMGGDPEKPMTQFFLDKMFSWSDLVPQVSSEPFESEERAARLPQRKSPRKPATRRTVSLKTKSRNH